MKTLIDRAVSQVGTILLGKESQIRLSLACLFAQGHLLIEDLPGMGKTTLSQALAKIFGLSYNRIQFTSDLLPSDMLGVSIFDKNTSAFNFHKGPIFAQMILADEINRTTPKSQSALLEAMEERQVTIDGFTHQLPSPFFVIATQNPMTQTGTFPLPESQLDRFLMCLTLGYPNQAAERELLKGSDRRDMLIDIEPCIVPDQLQDIQEAIKKVKASDLLLDYLQRIVEYTRQGHTNAGYGLSPRGAQALLKSAKTWAFMEGRHHVIPEDIQHVLGPVVEHRLREYGDVQGRSSKGLAASIIAEVDTVK